MAHRGGVNIDKIIIIYQYVKGSFEIECYTTSYTAGCT